MLLIKPQILARPGWSVDQNAPEDDLTSICACKDPPTRWRSQGAHAMQRPDELNDLHLHTATNGSGKLN